VLTKIHLWQKSTGAPMFRADASSYAISRQEPNKLEDTLALTRGGVVVDWTGTRVGSEEIVLSVVTELMRLPKVREIPVALRSGTMAAIVSLMVKALPLPRVLSILQAKGRLGGSSFEAHELARIARATVRLGPRFGVGECLVRSLVLYHLLRRSAYNPVLLIGARLRDGQFDGHCWIEVDGKSLCEFNEPRESFKLVYRFEA
jgi:hypothetical protein